MESASRQYRFISAFKGYCKIGVKARGVMG